MLQTIALETELQNQEVFFSSDFSTAAVHASVEHLWTFRSTLVENHCLIGWDPRPLCIYLFTWLPDSHNSSTPPCKQKALAGIERIDPHRVHAHIFAHEIGEGSRDTPLLPAFSDPVAWHVKPFLYGNCTPR